MTKLTLLPMLAAFTFLSCGSNSPADLPDSPDVENTDTQSPDIQQPDGPVTCETQQDCPESLPQCDQAFGLCVECVLDSHCPEEEPHCNPDGQICSECVIAADCDGELNCLDGSCSNLLCIPGTTDCEGSLKVQCSTDGLDPHGFTEDCEPGVCHLGECLECVPDSLSCQGNLIVLCNGEGSGFTIEENCGDLQCLNNQCLYCYPGTKQCEGQNAMLCSADGTTWELAEDCGALGLVCLGGTCISSCTGNIKMNTNAGCEFFAVDLQNAYSFDVASGTEYDAQNAQFALIASNTSPSEVATVTVTRPDGYTETVDVAPRTLHEFLLPPLWGISGTEQAQKAFKINSTQPITVYQFNPLSNEGVFSNDASVLLPSNVAGTEYFVASWRQTGQYHSNFVLVGVSKEPVVANVTVTARTVSGEGLPSLEVGQSWNVQVEQGQTVAFEAAQTNGDGDLTGSRIVADGPIAVFGAHTAANTGERCCADHLEQQLTPVSAWGKDHLVSRSWFRWFEQDYVRIISSKDNTHVEIIPPLVDVPVLNQGEHFTFQTAQDIEVRSQDNPIMVIQYLASSHEILGVSYSWQYYSEGCLSNSDCPPQYSCIGNPDYPGISPQNICFPPSCFGEYDCPPGHLCKEPGLTGYCLPIGDPAMIQAVPLEQFVDSYVFLVPDEYLRNYMNVIAPLDATFVELDGLQLAMTGFSQIGDSNFGVYRKELSAGVHYIHSDREFGITVYGYDDDVSYGYPGGLGVEKLD